MQYSLEPEEASHTLGGDGEEETESLKDEVYLQMQSFRNQLLPSPRLPKYGVR